MQQNTANRKDQLEPGQREKGNTVFGSHPLLAQHDAQGQHCACSTDEDAAHSHPCVGFLNTRSCEHPPPSYHAAQLSYSELFLSVHNSHLLREPFTIVAYNFFFSPPPLQDEKISTTQGSHLPAHCELIDRQPQVHSNKQCMGKHCSARCSAARTPNRARPPQ